MNCVRRHWSHSKLNHSKLNRIRMNRRYSLNVQVL